MLALKGPSGVPGLLQAAPFGAQSTFWGQGQASRSGAVVVGWTELPPVELPPVAIGRVPPVATLSPVAELPPVDKLALVASGVAVETPAS